MVSSIRKNEVDGISVVFLNGAFEVVLMASVAFAIAIYKGYKNFYCLIEKAKKQKGLK